MRRAFRAAQHGPETRKPPVDRGFHSVRDTGIEPVTSSVSGKRATAAPIAPKKGCSVLSGGGDGIRTRVNGFAGRCLAARPRHRVWFDPRVVFPVETRTRADDETRTRDPHLGKVMRYQLRYIRILSSRSLGATDMTLAEIGAHAKPTAVRACHATRGRHVSESRLRIRYARIRPERPMGDWRSW